MNLSPGILLIFGIGVFGGILSAIVVKRLSIPQVLGYILMGVLIGNSGLRLVSQADIDMLKPFNFFALGIIGFLVGSEIRFSTLKKYGRQFSAILFAEGILAFLFVGIPVTLIMITVTHSIPVSIATGVVFGAIASATDPASTINVLWEYRAAGALTTTLIAIVALDDALAMTLYGLGTSLAQILSGGDAHILNQLFIICFDLFGSIGLGIGAGFLLNYFLHRSAYQDHVTSAALGILLLCIGLSVRLNMDVILTTMAIGITVVNLSPRRSQELINHLKSLSTPIYILFFVLVGARLGISSMPGWLWIIVLVYIIGRSFGKIVGAWFGAKITNADDVVRKFTGIGLFAQGGVAIGLSIMASQHLNNIHISEELFLGDVIIFGITATTFIVQVIGPPLVKVAVHLSGEIGKNLTEDDIIAKWKVMDVMNRNITSVVENSPLRTIFERLQTTTLPFLPVVDESNKLLGIISIDQIKDAILDDSFWDWLVASDIMAPPPEIVIENQSLSNAINLMNQLYTEHLPVFSSSSDGVITGILDRRSIKQAVNREILSLRTTAG
ncbi:MAG: cation:proton antiporter [Candidatus Marinimicrobia bacterium]|nr:cation:proton antiporter [Candidatus Neomarinimicrobiota bacterium]